MRLKMIKFRNRILENYSIDPETAVITNSKGEIQKTYINRGRPEFKKMAIHVIQVHTHVGYKQGFDIHHIDENKMNNSLSNLVYLTRSKHAKIHHKGENNVMFGKHHSEETKQKMSEAHKNMSEATKRKISAANKGENNPFYGKHHSSETKRKISEASKDRIWINNAIVNKLVKIDSDIPEGFVRGRLKNEKRKI